MKRVSSIVTAVLGLGLSAAGPAMARDFDRGRSDADDRRPVRIDSRDDRDRREDHGRFDRDDHRRFDRDDDRVIVERPVVIERPVEVVAPCPAPDVDVNVQLCDVPRNVVDTATCQNLGGITSIQFVRRDGHEFYRFMIANRGTNWDLRVEPNGKLLGIDRC